jgi:Tol biopolymer transport system component
MRRRILITPVLGCSASAAWSSGALQTSSKPEVRFLTTDAGAIDYWPCFSPDGNIVLFSRTRDNRKSWDLFVIPIAGGEARRLSRPGVSSMQSSSSNATAWAFGKSRRTRSTRITPSFLRTGNVWCSRLGIPRGAMQRELPS